MLFGCDGNRSRVRQEIFGQEQSTNHPIPVSMFGFTMQITAEQAKPIRSLDPFFMQGTASANDVSMYTSRESPTAHAAIVLELAKMRR
jgi:2-polyprenyl-6-methoxyphenol hydroxylase-like FAD-dependent oxidoreductase